MSVFGRIIRGLATADVPAGEGAVWMVGDGGYGIGAVGESNYQPALEALAGGRKPRGVRLNVMAELVPEDENPHDAQAVAVDIEGRRVGYLSRKHARVFREEVASARAEGMRVHCRGRIQGGWDRGRGDRGHFGVWLDIASGDPST